MTMQKLPLVRSMTALQMLVLVAMAAGICAQDFEIQPVNPNTGTTTGPIYINPFPSETVGPTLVGPVKLLKAATINMTDLTMTVPLYYGQTNVKGETMGFWYIVTDTSDQGLATQLGYNHSPKLGFGVAEHAFRTGTLDAKGLLTTDFGYVDFSPERKIVAGMKPDFFPPKMATPGGVGMDGYTPLLKVSSNFFNAPIVAGDFSVEELSMFCGGIPKGMEKKARTMIHDRVKSICPQNTPDGIGGGTITLGLVQGYAFGKPLFYISTDAVNEVAAAIEQAVYAPALSNLRVGGDGGLWSPTERIFITINGITNGALGDNPLMQKFHPLRQGLNSALRGDGDPLNVLGGIPTVGTDYSPYWDVQLGVWTKAAIAAGFRTKITDEFVYLGNVAKGFITGPDGAKFGPTGLIVNCPVVMRLL